MAVRRAARFYVQQTTAPRTAALVSQWRACFARPMCGVRVSAGTIDRVFERVVEEALPPYGVRPHPPKVMETHSSKVESLVEKLVSLYVPQQDGLRCTKFSMRILGSRMLPTVSGDAGHAVAAIKKKISIVLYVLWPIIGRARSQPEASLFSSFHCKTPLRALIDAAAHARTPPLPICIQ